MQLISSLPSALTALGCGSVVAVSGVSTTENHWINRVKIEEMSTVAEVVFSLSILFSIYVVGLMIIVSVDFFRRRHDPHHETRFKEILNIEDNRLYGEWKEREARATLLGGSLVSLSLSILLTFRLELIGTDSEWIKAAFVSIVCFFLIGGGFVIAVKIARAQFADIDKFLEQEDETSGASLDTNIDQAQ